jgi:hypothetical protein
MMRWGPHLSAGSAGRSSVRGTGRPRRPHPSLRADPTTAGSISRRAAMRGEPDTPNLVILSAAQRREEPPTSRTKLTRKEPPAQRVQLHLGLTRPPSSPRWTHGIRSSSFESLHAQWAPRGTGRLGGRRREAKVGIRGRRPRVPSGDAADLPRRAARPVAAAVASVARRSRRAHGRHARPGTIGAGFARRSACPAVLRIIASVYAFAAAAGQP